MMLLFILIGRLFKFMATRDGKRPTAFLSSVIKPFGFIAQARKKKEKKNFGSATHY